MSDNAVVGIVFGVIGAFLSAAGAWGAVRWSFGQISSDISTIKSQIQSVINGDTHLFGEIETKLLEHDRNIAGLMVDVGVLKTEHAQFKPRCTANLP